MKETFCILISLQIISFFGVSAEFNQDIPSFIVRGFRDDGDKMLHTEIIYRPAIRNKIHSIFKEFPLNNKTLGVYITQFYVLDLDNTAADILDIQGGVFRKRVSFRLVSGVGRGLRYNFTVWGFR